VSDPPPRVVCITCDLLLLLVTQRSRKRQLGALIGDQRGLGAHFYSQGTAHAATRMWRKRAHSFTHDTLPPRVTLTSHSRHTVFVRFLGRCTGRAGLPQLADTFVTDPSKHFSAGQVCLMCV
jgi:hypothetical protein